MLHGERFLPIIPHPSAIYIYLQDCIILKVDLIPGALTASPGWGLVHARR